MKTKIAHFLLHLLEEAPFGPVSESAAFQPGGSWWHNNWWVAYALSSSAPFPVGQTPWANHVLNLSCRAETAPCTGDASHPSHDVFRGFPSLGCWLCSFPVKEVLSLLPDVFESVSRSQAHLYSVLTLPAWIYTAGARHPSRAEHPSVFRPGTEVCVVSCCWLSTSFRGVSCKPRSMIWIHLWLGRIPQAEGEWVGVSTGTLSSAGC